MIKQAHSWNEYLESRVLSASPTGLIEILYEKALESVVEARRHLRSGNVAERGKCVSRAQAIFAELIASMDVTKGGAVGYSLLRLYEYAQFRLTEAHRYARDSDLLEVEKLTENMLQGWRGVVNHPDPEIHTVPLFEAMEAGAAHTVSLPSRSWSL